MDQMKIHKIWNLHSAGDLNLSYDKLAESHIELEKEMQSAAQLKLPELVAKFPEQAPAPTAATINYLQQLLTAFNEEMKPFTANEKPFSELIEEYYKNMK
jgi:uncharacterized protein YtpQ (UPF0354 family)